MKELSRNDAITLCSPLPFVLVTANDENEMYRAFRGVCDQLSA
jgi:hypothetical protein